MQKEILLYVLFKIFVVSALTESVTKRDNKQIELVQVVSILLNFNQHCIFESASKLIFKNSSLDTAREPL